jgi:hypothetical protein
MMPVMFEVVRAPRRCAYVGRDRCLGSVPVYRARMCILSYKCYNNLYVLMTYGLINLALGLKDSSWRKHTVQLVFFNSLYLMLCVKRCDVTG